MEICTTRLTTAVGKSGRKIEINGDEMQQSVQRLWQRYFWVSNKTISKKRNANSNNTRRSFVCWIAPSLSIFLARSSVIHNKDDRDDRGIKKPFTNV
eukprot:scaffold516_cov175-Amphora_coffeaeformis.AAC.27